jgi:hypothetical protein
MKALLLTAALHICGNLVQECHELDCRARADSNLGPVITSLSYRLVGQDASRPGVHVPRLISAFSLPTETHYVAYSASLYSASRTWLVILPIAPDCLFVKWELRTKKWHTAQCNFQLCGATQDKLSAKRELSTGYIALGYSGFLFLLVLLFSYNVDDTLNDAN